MPAAATCLICAATAFHAAVLAMLACHRLALAHAATITGHAGQSLTRPQPLKAFLPPADLLLLALPASATLPELAPVGPALLLLAAQLPL
eukprot:CAMPEP_0202873328 /NCGR_PEP_ID=MMETSP1391-20130828/23075_1 /ASSEMBLY_ACC=CAM_ASM_000867 /TAXON_ID=1034604 /ORGANISM="Chlamydomonas leiostraca, Strain SAG 11-49" /LENGTH=89 /DNA_ID=CAMNT_0049554533 /DNA_START=498 /DNA_END=764 /DNA_ORIENTATION=-